jgi:DivIVA domain-containing protein
MHLLTPRDLEHAEFKRALRGYDIAEVRKLLQRAAQEIAALNHEIRNLRDENEKLEPLHRQVATMMELILMSQKTADEREAKAREEAEAITEAARAEAEQILAEARDQARELGLEYRALLDGLKRQIERTAIEKGEVEKTYRAFLQDQIDALETASARPVPLAVVASDTSIKV